jgi:hypothetical protein
MTSTKTKAAKDGAEFEAYPTYSMAVLWSMDALKLTHDVGENPIFEAPLDGDALARAGYRTRANQGKWDVLKLDCLELLRNNHGEIGRNNR